MGEVTAFAAVLLAAAAPTEACNSLPGWSEAIADNALRYIIVGEIHGSNEIPAVFADIACLTSLTRRVVVAVEQPSRDQPAIDRFIASNGDDAAQRAFLEASMWNQPYKDGRSSQAAFRLFERLRQMRAAGRIRAVVAIQPTDETGNGAKYERSMADLLISAGGPGHIVVALVGNIHALRRQSAITGGYEPMAGHLPPKQTRTFTVEFTQGDTWACTGQPMTCGPQHWSPIELRTQPRGVILTPGDTARYSATINLGTTVSTSPPQAALNLPAPTAFYPSR